MSRISCSASATPIFVDVAPAYTAIMFDASATAAPPRRSQLLVSVRSLDEAMSVSAAGVDVIDFKEPLHGPLAPVDASLWNAAARILPDAVLSAALGEPDTAVTLAAQVPREFRFAKVGPSGLRTASQLQRCWQDLSLAESVELVPVAYADHDAADCVDVNQVLDCVIATGRSRLLIDTYSKDGRSLTDLLSEADLVAFLGRARAAGIWVALAGSLRLDQVQRLVQQEIRADCWGVRGDVCVADADGNAAQRRAGELDGGRVEQWMQALGKRN